MRDPSSGIIDSDLNEPGKTLRTNKMLVKKHQRKSFLKLQKDALTNLIYFVIILIFNSHLFLVMINEFSDYE